MNEIYDNTILIIEDEPILLQMTKEHLSERISNVLTAKDGMEALEILKTTKIDLALVDIKMPRMDGIALMTHMKTIAPTTLCVVLTAHGDKAILKQAFELGAYNFLEKPCQTHILDNCIKNALEHVNFEKTKMILLYQLLENYTKTSSTEFNKLSKGEQKKILESLMGLIQIKHQNDQAKY